MKKDLKTTITKKFTFEAAHSLPNHDGKCKNLHGHSYCLEVTLYEKKKTKGPEEGMIYDFAKLSKLVQKYILDKWDHQNLNEILPFTTTVENLAEECFRILESQGLSVERIRLWETAKCYAEVSR